MGKRVPAHFEQELFEQILKALQHKKQLSISYLRDHKGTATEYVICPVCSGFIALPQYHSISYEYLYRWSDLKKEYRLYSPDTDTFQKCPNCYTLHLKIEARQCNYVIDNTSKINSPPSLKEADYVYIAEKLCDDEDEIIGHRIKALQKANDQFRENSCYRISDSQDEGTRKWLLYRLRKNLPIHGITLAEEKSGLFGLRRRKKVLSDTFIEEKELQPVQYAQQTLQNMKDLLDFMPDKHPGHRYVKGEILRYLGEFHLSRQMLRSVHTDKYHRVTVFGLDACEKKLNRVLEC